jgi:serine/threonine protein kinase
MGTVWKADDTEADRMVVVKEIRLQPDLDADERELLAQRAMREARAIGRLNRHPNVVELYDVVRDGGVPWLVLALVESRSLDEVVAADGPLPPERVAEIGVEVLAALRAAHAAGVVHRDVKPANVLLADDGRVVLTDFGLATVRGDPSLTLTGMIIGSPAYIAPERGRGGRVRPESDLWSLGATLYLAVEGRTPYDRRKSRALVHTGMAGDPEPMANAGPLRPVLLGLLTSDPDKRLRADEATRKLKRIAEPPKPKTGTHSSGRRRPSTVPRKPSEGIHRVPAETRRAPQPAPAPPSAPAPGGRHREPTAPGPGYLPYIVVGLALVAILAVILLAVYI